MASRSFLLDTGSSAASLQMIRMSERQKQIHTRQMLKWEYGWLFDAIASLLFRYDMMGINFGLNTDEYEPETGTILPRLDAEASTAKDACYIVYEEFCKWFNLSDTERMSDYQSLADEMWILYQCWLQNPNSARYSIHFE